MGQGFKHRPEGLDALAARIDSLQRQLDDLRTAAPLQNSTISQGGTVTIDGGQLVVLDSNGKVVVTLGHDTAGARGAALTSPAGVDMLNFFIRASDGLPIIELNAATGDPIIVNDPNGDQSGIAWPWIPVPFGSNITSQWPAWTTGTFTTIQVASTSKFSQGLTALAQTVCDSGATAGQLRLLCNGTQVGATAAVTTAASVATFSGHPADAYGNSCLLELQARVTAGAGNVRGAIYQCMWNQF